MAKRYFNAGGFYLPAFKLKVPTIISSRNLLENSPYFLPSKQDGFFRVFNGKTGFLYRRLYLI